jgi:Flp pilus assembly pilin Flp
MSQPMTPRAPSSRGIRPLLSERAGAAYVEYLSLLTLVTLVGAGAVAALGLPLLRMFRFAEVILLLPSP